MVVAPGADPAIFALSIGGATGVTLDATTGDLVLDDGGGGGARSTRRWSTRRSTGSGGRWRAATRCTTTEAWGSEVGEYDRTVPLVIDPTLVYSTYLGGSGSGSNGLRPGFGIAVDTSGNAYVTGVTTSADFPGTALNLPQWLR